MVAPISTTTMRRSEVASAVLAQETGTGRLYSESRTDGVCTMQATGAAVAAAMPPEIDSITPNTGATAGGTAVTITGRGFSAVTEGFTDVNALDSLVVVSDTEITAVTKPDTRNANLCPVVQGQVDLTLESPNGSGALPGGFTYADA